MKKILITPDNSIYEVVETVDTLPLVDCSDLTDYIEAVNRIQEVSSVEQWIVPESTLEAIKPYLSVYCRSKNRKEIEDLKKWWREDPCWDIYETEGFESHREELLLYQEKVERENVERKENEFITFVQALGISNNPELGKYLKDLDQRLSRLEEE